PIPASSVGTPADMRVRATGATALAVTPHLCRPRAALRTREMKPPLAALQLAWETEPWWLPLVKPMRVPERWARILGHAVGDVTGRIRAVDGDAVVVDDEAGTLGGRRERDRAADAPPGSGDGDDLVRQEVSVAGAVDPHPGVVPRARRGGGRRRHAHLRGLPAGGGGPVSAGARPAPGGDGHAAGPEPEPGGVVHSLWRNRPLRLPAGGDARAVHRGHRSARGTGRRAAGAAATRGGVTSAAVRRRHAPSTALPHRRSDSGVPARPRAGAPTPCHDPHSPRNSVTEALAVPSRRIAEDQSGEPVTSRQHRLARICPVRHGCRVRRPPRTDARPAHRATPRRTPPPRRAPVHRGQPRARTGARSAGRRAPGAAAEGWARDA